MNYITHEGKKYKVQSVVIDYTTSGTKNTIPSPGATKRILVLELIAWAANSQTVKIQDTAGTPVVVLPTITAGAGGLWFPFQFNPAGHFEPLAIGVGLDIVLGAAAVFSGTLKYAAIN